MLTLSSNLQSNNFSVIARLCLFDKEILKLIHLDNNVGKILLLLLIKIKITLLVGSSTIFSKALIEFIFKSSILSINTNLGFLLNEDLLRFTINSRT